MLFSSVEVLLGHGNIPFEGIIYRANRLIEQVGELDTIEDFLSTFKVTLFKVFLDQAEWTDEKVCEDAKYSDEVEGKSRPEAGCIVYHSCSDQGDESDLQSVSDEKVIEFHGVRR